MLLLMIAFCCTGSIVGLFCRLCDQIPTSGIGLTVAPSGTVVMVVDVSSVFVLSGACGVVNV